MKPTPLVLILVGCSTLSNLDLDGDGWTKGDCDDLDDSVHPEAFDPIGDTADQDCDGHDGVYIAPPELDFVTVAAGRFTMGSPPDEPGHLDGETLHTVTLSRDMEISLTEVTELHFEVLMGRTPDGAADCDTCPAVGPSWHEAAAFTNALSEAEGLPACYQCSGEGAAVGCATDPGLDSIYACEGYRLPTEAEWERAVRAGSAGAFQGDRGLDEGDSESCEGDLALDDGTLLAELSWFCGISDYEVWPVGSLAANAWGIHDGHGNAMEWVHDGYNGGVPLDDSTDPLGGEHELVRVIRGGSAHDSPGNQRAAYRNGLIGGSSLPQLGFRVARTLP